MNEKKSTTAAVPWAELTEDQKKGMMQSYWESLTPEQQRVLVDPICIEPGCKKKRWAPAGAFYCDEHAHKHSDEIIAKYDQEHGGGSA